VRKSGVQRPVSELYGRFTHDIGSQTGEVLVLDIVVPEQPQGRVDQRVVNVTADRDGGVDLA